MTTLQTLQYKQVVRAAIERWDIIPPKPVVRAFVDRCVRRGLVSFPVPLTDQQLNQALWAQKYEH